MDITLRDIRPDDAPALAHVLVTANAHAFRGLVPDHLLEFSEAESAANWKRMLTEGLPDGDFMIAAETARGEFVGYAWGGAYDDPRYPGELRQLMVLPAYQKRGIGRLLVRQVAKRLAAQSIHRMRVEVLHINPNRAFYERLGGVFVEEGVWDWDGVLLPKYVYGWSDTSSLATSV